MKRYMVTEVNARNSEVTEKGLNNLAKEGWEVVFVFATNRRDQLGVIMEQELADFEEVDEEVEDEVEFELE